MNTTKFNLDKILLINDVLFNEKDRIYSLMSGTKHKVVLRFYERKLKDLEELREYIIKNNLKR